MVTSKDYFFNRLGGGVRMMKDDEERCCGNCLWMGREDILGNGWCYKKDCETSCDKVCKKHEF